MVGTGMCAVSSPMVDSHTPPCSCLVALTSSRINQTSNGDSILRMKPVSRKLSSSFMNSRFLTKAIGSKKQKRIKDFVIVNSIGGQYDDMSFSDVKTQIFNLFTLTAVKTVMNQLYETDRAEHEWLDDFVRTNKPADGKRFLHILQKEKHELAERVMVTRLHLFAKWIKDLDHDEMYKNLSDQNLELMRERLLETVRWPSDDTDTNTKKVG